MSAIEFHLKAQAHPDGGYFATAETEGQTAYGHGANALAACINALANAHFADFTETEAGDA